MTNIRLIDIDTGTSEKVTWHYKFVTEIILRIKSQELFNKCCSKTVKKPRQPSNILILGWNKSNWPSCEFLEITKFISFIDKSHFFEKTVD